MASGGHLKDRILHRCGFFGSVAGGRGAGWCLGRQLQASSQRSSVGWWPSKTESICLSSRIPVNPWGLALVGMGSSARVWKGKGPALFHFEFPRYNTMPGIQLVLSKH
jgi:hypothetical protein